MKKLITAVFFLLAACGSSAFPKTVPNPDGGTALPVVLTIAPLTDGGPTNDQNIAVGTEHLPVLGFQLTANNEPVVVKSLTLTITGSVHQVLDLMNISLYTGGSMSPFATANQLNSISDPKKQTYTWVARDNLLPAPIQPGSPVSVYVTAGIGGIGQAILSDNFQFSLDSGSDIVAFGSTTNANGVFGTAKAGGTSYITPALRISISGDYPGAGTQNTAIDSGTIIGRFVVLNESTNKTVTITGLKFTDAGNHHGNTTTYRLYYSGQSSIDYTGNTALSGNQNLDFSDLAGHGGSAFTLEGRTSRYVSVAIDSIGNATAGDSWQLSVQKLGDVLYSVQETVLGYDGTGNGKLGDTVTNLPVEGYPELGKLVKQ